MEEEEGTLKYIISTTGRIIVLGGDTFRAFTRKGGRNNAIVIYLAGENFCKFDMFFLELGEEVRHFGRGRMLPPLGDPIIGYAHEPEEWLRAFFFEGSKKTATFVGSFLCNGHLNHGEEKKERGENGRSIHLV